ncbi:MAG TPA: oxygenase MpaB family protein [Solirubrobacterales bacterium]|nr:oxygenase MpaB family protein [Solirubrobacterales bacterium]
MHYFPPGESIARRVHGERSVGLLYGQRALLIGALEPLTYTGTMLSTKAGDRPFERLVRTAKAQETIFLGTKAEADRILARVHHQHERVKGSLPEGAGPYPPGSTYSAFDPELMLWTLAVIADSGRAIYETTVRSLSDAEREGLWQDYLRFGELFGMPREVAPSTYPEFAAWFAAKLASPELMATPHALEFAPVVAFEQPVPVGARLNRAVQNLLVKGTLPPRVREIFGIPWGASEEAAFRTLATSHRAAHHLMPHKVRRGRNDAFFDVVADAELRRGGTPMPSVGARG